MIISIQTHDVQALSLFSPGWNILTCFHKQENRIRRTLSRNTRSGYVRLTNVAARLRVYIHNLMSCNKPNCFVWVNNVWISSSSDSVFSTDRHLWLRSCSHRWSWKKPTDFPPQIIQPREKSTEEVLIQLLYSSKSKSIESISLLE